MANIIDTLKQTAGNIAGLGATQAVPEPLRGTAANVAFAKQGPTGPETKQAPTADDVLAMITSRKGAVDPTAQGQTATSPLTNGAVPGTQSVPGGVDSGYSVQTGVIYDSTKSGHLSYDYDPKGKTYQLYSNDAYGNKTPVFLLGDPNNPAQSRVVSYNTAIQDAVSQYYKNGVLDKNFKRQILTSGGVPTRQAKSSMQQGGPDKIFVQALLNTLNNISLRNFTDGQTTHQFYSFEQAALGVSPLKTSTSTSVMYTPKDMAAKDISTFIQQYLGRGATSKEINDYYTALNQFEKAHPTKSTVTTDITGTEKSRVSTAAVTDSDKQFLKVAVLSNALQDRGIDVDRLSVSGGQIGQAMQAFKKAAADYGITHVDNNKALSMAIDMLKPGNDINTEVSKMKEQAKLLYKPLASYIDAGGKVTDIADSFNALNQKYMETYTPTDINNPDIQKALLGDGKSIMSTNDYISMLKSKPEWRYTQNAREQASDFAMTILKNFGLMG